MNRKSIIYKYIIIVLFLSSCDQEVNSTYEEELMIFHNLIGEILLKNDQYQSAIVQLETKPIYKSFYKLKKDFPPPPGTLIFSQAIFKLLVEKKFLKANEADYMFSTIDSTRRFYIDSTKINKPLINEHDIDSLFLAFAGKKFIDLESRYGANSFIKFGTPIFNLNHTKVLITTEIFSNTEMNQHLIYIFKFRENKWRIIHELEMLW